MFTPHHVSHVKCHKACVICQVSHVRCHMSIFFLFVIFKSGLSNRWRVSYQRGLPRLINIALIVIYSFTECCYAVVIVIVIVITKYKAIFLVPPVSPGVIILLRDWGTTSIAVLVRLTHWIELSWQCSTVMTVWNCSNSMQLSWKYVTVLKVWNCFDSLKLSWPILNCFDSQKLSWWSVTVWIDHGYCRIGPCR